MLVDILKEYRHLQKTKVGVDIALKRKEVILATECRKVSADDGRRPILRLFSAILLEKINGR